MKKTYFTYFYLFFLVFSAISFKSQSQTSNFTSSARKLIYLFGKIHPKPIVINDTTSAEITELFIKDLDIAGDILIEEDIDSLLKYRNQLFTDIFNNHDDYLNNALKIYKHALNRNDSILNLIEKSGIDFKKNDTLFFSPVASKPHYSENFATHKKRLMKYLKYRCFLRVYNNPDIEKISEQVFLIKAKEISHRIIQKSRKEVDELKLKKDEFVKVALLNSIAQRYDPHSNYFSLSQKEQFNEQISSQIESYGFNISEDKKGNIILANIVPGSSAWQTNQINENDLLLSMKIGSFEYFSSDYEAYEMQEKLSQSAEKVIDLQIKKMDGQIKNLRLVQQKTISGQNIVKGYLLKHQSDKLGYIALPSFYTDMSDERSPGCVNEVAKEIVKLENDTIKGLIIDLRNNGGGSMKEATDLAGLFVNEGPLFLFKLKGYKPQISIDYNRGELFSKPVLVLINESSASASELFCNIIKEYNIGLIVGQKSFGKGSAQIVLPLDSNAFNTTKPDIEEFVKITDGFFYKLDNSTHQSIGVIPDIMLPEAPLTGKYNEAALTYHLVPESIVKKVDFMPLAKKDISSNKNLSADRINKSRAFNQYMKYTNSINTQLASPFKLCLNYKDFIRYLNQEKAIFDSLDNAFKNEENEINCLNYSFVDVYNNKDALWDEFNSGVLDAIQKDIFIKESFYILMDYLKL